MRDDVEVKVERRQRGSKRPRRYLVVYVADSTGYALAVGVVWQVENGYRWRELDPNVRETGPARAEKDFATALAAVVALARRDPRVAAA